MEKSALIIEDHPVYRDALRVFLRGIFGEQNVRAVSSVEEALADSGKANSYRLILLDLGLPGINGVEAVITLQRAFPSAAIAVVSASEDRREVAAVLRAGAKVYLSKAVSIQVISHIVQKILEGTPLESKWITLKGSQITGSETVLELTPRQKEVLNELCQGLSNKEIGMRLGLAEITVKIHISAIFRILGVINRTQAVLAARRLGLYSQEQSDGDAAADNQIRVSAKDVMEVID